MGRESTLKVPSDDRTIHASYDDMEIVRYDRSGKWYLEPTIADLKRQHVGVGDAARSAVWGRDNANGVIHWQLPGGRAFDRACTKEAVRAVLGAKPVRSFALPKAVA